MNPLDDKLIERVFDFTRGCASGCGVRCARGRVFHGKNVNAIEPLRLRGGVFDVRAPNFSSVRRPLSMPDLKR
jgi:hypothetical protein